MDAHETRQSLAPPAGTSVAFVATRAGERRTEGIFEPMLKKGKPSNCKSQFLWANPRAVPWVWQHHSPRLVRIYIDSDITEQVTCTLKKMKVELFICRSVAMIINVS